MIDPTEKDVGRRVIYARNDPHRTTEMGVYSSRNEHCCFVRYSTGDTAAATDPADLEWHDEVPDGTCYHDRTTDPSWMRMKGDGMSDIYTGPPEKDCGQ